MRNEKSNGWGKKKTAGKWIGSANFFGNLPKGLPPGKGPVDFQAGAFSYALISNYVPVVCLMLPDTINGCLMVSPGQMRHSTLQTLYIYISLRRRRRTPQWPRQTEREREKKKNARLSLHKHHVMKYKWINGSDWDGGINRQNFPYRLSRLYEHDILIDVTNKHELFSLGMKAGNWICLCVLQGCRWYDSISVGGGGHNDLDFKKLPSELWRKYCILLIEVAPDEQYWGRSN